jgi:GT2 family glycosyltransferase/serine acetyltransferase
MRLAVVILTHQHTDLATDCLKSLEGEIDPGQDRVIVVDNGSDDGTAERLRGLIGARGWAAWASLLALERNGGFCVGNNAALRRVLAEPDPPRFVFLLNDDTYLRPGALQALLDFMAHHPRAAIAGSRLEDPDGRPQPSARRFHSIASEVEGALRFGPLSRLLHARVVAPPPRPEAHATDWVVGAAMLVRREVFDRIGLLDERFFLYFDEADFCLQARRAGFECWYVPQSRIVHLIGQSTGLRWETRAQRRLPAYWFESRRHFFQKNFGWWYAAAADAGLVAASLLRRLRALLQASVEGDAPHYLRDVVTHGLWPRRSRGSDEDTRLRLFDLLREDWIAHGRDRTRPGFRAVAVCRFGQWCAQRRGRRVLRPLHRFLERRTRNRLGIELPASVRLGRRVVIEHQGVVVHGAAEIGDDCILRQGVTLGNRHLDRAEAAPRLGARVNVGAGAKLLGAISIGDGATIGANAVVLDDTPAGATTVGVPARVVRRSETQR